MNILFQTLAALFLVFPVSAQDLAHKIPYDAFAVVNIQTDHFFELMTIDDFDRSTIGKTIIEKSRGADPKGVNSIADFGIALDRSEEHTSELQSLMRISYAVSCLKYKNSTHLNTTDQQPQHHTR